MRDEGRARRVVAAGLLLLGLRPAAAPAQGTADTVRYTEAVRATVTTYSGTAARERRVVRDARYSWLHRGDTMLVVADTLALSEVAAGGSRTIDVDAVIGGRWKLLARADSLVVVERPFVPQDVSDVSDVAAAMDDFLPATPPPLRPGASTRTGVADWTRLADSSGMERYRWLRRVARDTSRTVADSVTIRSRETTTERGALAWRAGSGPHAWRREVSAQVSTTMRGRVVRAEVEQVVAVRRDS